MIAVKINDIIKQYNKTAKHQQDLIQSELNISKCIPAGTHASTPHLLKTLVKTGNFTDVCINDKGKKTPQITVGIAPTIVSEFHGNIPKVIKFKKS